MKDEDKTKAQLIEELAEIRQQLQSLQDLSERKQAEKLLQESEMRLKRAEKIGKIGNWEYDLITNRIIWSDQVYELFERDLEQGLPTEDEESQYYSREDNERLRELAKQVSETGVPAQDYEFGVNLKSGRKSTFLGSMYPINNELGQIIKLYGTFQDITERKKAEEALRENEERYRNLIEQMPSTIFIHVDGKFVFLNQAGLKMLGASCVEDLIGKPILDIVHPDFRPLVLDLIHQIREYGEVLSQKEGKIVRLDGKVIDVAVSAIPYTYEGKPDVQVVANDITGRRQAEDYFQTLLRITRDGFWIVGQDHRFKFVNDACCQMYGYSKEELLALSIFDLEAYESLEDIERRTRVLETSGYDIFEGHHRRKDGKIIDVEVSVTYIKREKVFFAFLRDITDRKHMEREQIRLQRLRAVGELSAGVSHNLNNILVGVLGPAEMLKMKTNDPDLLQDLNDIIASAMRAKDLVQRLHLSTRGLEEEGLQAVNVNSIVEEAVTITRPRWKDLSETRDITIEIITDLGSIPLIKGTESRLHDIFVNLVLNAVDAMPTGGTITIKTRTAEQYVEVIFSDTGIGMDEETVRRVFEPFFTTKKNVGSGLGLSTTYAAVTQWGGDIHLESQLGKGTTFTMMFPIWTESVSKEVHIIEKNHGKHSGKILIVDDDETVSSVLSRILMKEHSVEIAESGQDALEMFTQENYDVVLVDMGMPGMPGNIVIQEMHRQDPSIASVLMSGWIFDETDERVAAFDFRIQKPFTDISKVMDVVAQAMALHEQRKQNK